MKIIRTLTLFSASAALLFSMTAQATPSTQVWIPSTDIQKFKSLHLNYDVYARAAKPTILVLGPTVGVLPWNSLQAEIGFDAMLQNSEALDANPFYLHAKLATPEDSLFHFSPAIAAGIYNLGLQQALTGQNAGYGLLARTLPLLGRLSVGYYYGNPNILVDELGDPANHGVLASWDRTLTEVTDKLWLSVDFQSGRSMLGALSVGAAWAFSPNVSVIAGYDHYLNQAVTGRDTFTVQLDINLDFSSAPAPAPAPAAPASTDAVAPAVP